MQTNKVRMAFFWLATAAIAGCGGATEATPRTPTPVRVQVVAEPAQRGATRYSGSIEPAASVDMAFKVGGYVREVAQARGTARKLQAGDWVTKGTVLAVIKDADYKQKVWAARASLSQATASLRQARIDYDRAKALFDDNVVTRADLDNATSRRDISQAQVEAARASVSEAELALADCTLRAPFDGIVIRRNAEVGMLASPGALAFTVADTRTVKVIFGAPDNLQASLRIGDPVTVRVEALGRDLPAAITKISPSADSKNRTFDIEASLANQDEQLKVGMIVSIALREPAKPATTLALPLSAVVRAPTDPRGFAVFVVDGEVARVREVKLGEVLGSAVQVVAGLAPGDRVIATGTTFVTDGERVRVVR